MSRQKSKIINFELTIGAKPLLIMRCMGMQDMVYDMSKAMNRGELSKADNSFDVLARLLSFTGLELQYYNILDELYDEMITMDDTTLGKSLVGIVEMFPTEKIEKFLDSEDYKSPKYLRDEFDEKMVINKEGCRDRTYTKKDYRDLVVLTIKIKTIILILARYIYIHNININASDSIKIYRLINSIKDISSLPAYDKINNFIAKNIGGDDYVTELDISRILNKGITKTKFNNFIATSIMMFLGLVGSPDIDTPETSMVSDMSRLCKNKNSLNKNIMINNLEISVDEDDGNGAVTDTSLSVSEIPVSGLEEIPYFYRNREIILRQNKLPIDMKYLDEIEHIRPLLTTKKLDKVQKAILCWLFSGMMEAKYIRFFNKEIRTELRMIAYAILKTAGIDVTANIMLATIFDAGLYVSKENTQKADPDLEKKVDDLFNLGISRKTKNSSYGLSIIDSVESETTVLKELFIRPVVKRLANIKWISYHQKGDENLIRINNAREEVLKIFLLSYSAL